MTDDIVSRLRTALDEMELGCLGCSIINQNDHDSNCLTQEAADEIERLREDVIYWQALSYCPKCGCGQCQDNEEALNNE